MKVEPYPLPHGWEASTIGATTSTAVSDRAEAFVVFDAKTNTLVVGGAEASYRVPLAVVRRVVADVTREASDEG